MSKELELTEEQETLLGVLVLLFILMIGLAAGWAVGWWMYKQPPCVQLPAVHVPCEDDQKAQLRLLRARGKGCEPLAPYKVQAVNAGDVR